MVVECAQYGHLYNPEIAPQCPACFPFKNKKKGKKKKKKVDHRFDDINSYKRETIHAQKQLVISEKRSAVSAYERNTGKQVYSSKI